MKRVIKTVVAVAAFGLAAGICAPAQAQTYNASDIFNGLGGSSPTAGLGTGVLDLGLNRSDSFAGEQFAGGQFTGGQEMLTFGGQGILNGFRRARNIAVGSHYMPWAPPYAMERLICVSGNDPVYGTALRGVSPMAGPVAGPVPGIPAGSESLVAGPGGPVIPTPELVQPSVGEAAALAGQQPEAGGILDVAQQAAPPVDASAPQTAEQAAVAASQQAAAEVGAPAPQQADPAPQQAAAEMGAPAPQQADLAPQQAAEQAGAPAPQQVAEQAEAAPVASAVESVVGSAPVEELASVSDAVTEGTTATVGTPVAGASMESTELIAAG
jgi:hypothetical protein